MSETDSDSKWQRLWQLFHEARERAPHDRKAFLRQACGDDPGLRSEVEDLLNAEAEEAPLFEELAALSSDRDPLIGARVGPYRILELIGEGGMGAVYEAEQEGEVRRRVAFKVIKRGMDTREVVSRFETERQAVGLMNHPHIAQVYDAGAVEDGRPYFVMELVAGVPITDYCDQHRLPIRERLSLLVSVCEAVQHAHQKGILHRDLKPSNVLVAVQGGRPSPKVIDFGIAKALDRPLTESTFATQRGSFIGTPAYMSPEQAQMSRLDVDTRSDIYSLGVLLYQVLTGLLPFDPDTLASEDYGEIQRILREEEPPRPSTKVSGLGAEERSNVARRRRVAEGGLARELRGELDWITMKAIEKDRARRYPTVSELAADLLRYLDHQPILAAPPTLIYRTRKFLRRHWVGASAAATIAVLLVGFGIAMSLQSIRLSRSLHETQEQRHKAQEVSGFLMDLFRGLSPYRASRGGLQAREILDRGSERLDRELAGQPEIQAELRQIIAVGYRGLGIFDRAGTLFEEDLEARRQIYGPEHPSVAGALAELGTHYREIEDLDRAESLLREALAMYQRHGEEQPIPARYHLGAVLLQRGAYDEAEELLRHTLDLQRRRDADDHAMIAEILNALGSVHLLRGEGDDAIALLGEAVKHHRAAGGEHPGPGLAATLGQLGSVLSEKGDYAAAEPLLREALDLYRQSFGDRHPRVATGMNNLALLLYRRGELEEAATLYSEADEVLRQVFGEEHASPVNLNNRGLLERARGRLDEAEALFRQALFHTRDQAGEQHPNVAYPMNNLAGVLHEKGLLQEAEQLYREALELRRRTLPAGHPALGQSLRAYGHLLIDRGDPETALPLLREGLEIVRRASVPGSWQVGAAESLLGHSLAALARYEEAEALLVQGYRTMASERPGDPRTEAARLWVVSLYEAWGKAELAESYRARLAAESR